MLTVFPFLTRSSKCGYIDDTSLKKELACHVCVLISTSIDMCEDDCLRKTENMPASKQTEGQSELANMLNNKNVD